MPLSLCIQAGAPFNRGTIRFGAVCITDPRTTSSLPDAHPVAGHGHFVVHNSVCPDREKKLLPNPFLRLYYCEHRIYNVKSGE